MIRVLAAVTGAPAPIAVPEWLIRRFANSYLYGALTGNLTISNAKARAELGWAPVYPSIEAGLKTLVPGRISSAM